MPHILVIEDSYLFGQFISDAAVLAGVGSVDVAQGQGAAEQSAARKLPSLIVADVKLQDGSGVAAVERITSRTGPIPVVYLTGYPERLSGCPERARVIEKPVSHESLKGVLADFVDQFRRGVVHH